MRANIEKIGVVIPTCGIRGELWATVKSVELACQKSAPGQIVIFVNAGTDSKEYAKTIREKVPSFIDVIASQALERIPMAENWNRCADLIDLPYVHLLHDDDMISPYFYDAMDELMLHYPGGALYACSCIVFGKGHKFHYTGKEGLWSTAEADLKKRNHFYCPGVIFQKTKFSGFDTNLRYGFDWKAWQGLAAAGPVYLTEQPLALYREHAGSDTAAHVRTGRNVIEIADVLCELQGGGPGTDYSYATITACDCATEASMVGDLATTLIQLKLAKRFCPNWKISRRPIFEAMINRFRGCTKHGPRFLFGTIRDVALELLQSLQKPT